MSKQEDLALLGKRIREKRLMIRDIDKQMDELSDRRTALEREIFPLQKQADRISDEIEGEFRQQMKTEYLGLSEDHFGAITSKLAEMLNTPNGKIRFVQWVRHYSAENKLIFVGLREAVRLYEALC